MEKEQYRATHTKKLKCLHEWEEDKYQDKGEEWGKGEEWYKGKGEEWDKVEGEELECVLALKEEPELE